MTCLIADNAIRCKYNLNWNINGGPAIIWEGNGLEEKGRRADTNEIVIRIDPRYFRPTEVDILIGDAKKASQKLGWEPTISLEDLIEEMIEHDRKDAIKEALLNKEGFNINQIIS